MVNTPELIVTKLWTPELYR